MKNYCLYVFIRTPKKFLVRAPKFLKTALLIINGLIKKIKMGYSGAP